MKKYLLYSFVVSIAIGFVILIIFFFRPEQAGTSVFKAIPADAAIIIRVNGFQSISTELENNSFINYLKKLESSKELNRIASVIKTITDLNLHAKHIISDSTSILAIRLDKPGGDWMYLIPFNSNKRNNEQLVTSAINTGLLKKLETENVKKDTSIYIFIDNGILGIGNNAKWLNSSRIIAKTGKSVMSDTTFAKVFSTSGSKVPISIYMQTKPIANYFIQNASQSLKNYLKETISINDWIALDCGLDNHNISLRGFSKTIKKSVFWHEFIKNEQPAAIEFVNLLPFNTIAFGALTANDGYNYKIALDQDKDGKKLISTINDKYNYELPFELLDIFAGQVCIAFTQDDNKTEAYALVKCKNTVDATEYIISKSEKKKINRKTKKNTSDTPTQSNRIINLKSKDYLAALFGPTFKFSNTLYVANYNEYLIFGESEHSLLSLIDRINTGRLLTKDSAFRNSFTNIFASKANYSLFLNSLFIKEHLGKYLENNFHETLDSILNPTVFKPVFNIQISGNGDYNYWSINLKITNPLNDLPQQLWEYKTDTTPLQCAYLLTNKFIAKEKYFFVQDNNNTIYLLNINGKLQWRYKLESKLSGAPGIISQGKKHASFILFNTSNTIYLLNKEGKPVKGFPVKLKSKATNGISAVDFDGNQNFRFYIATENGKVLALNSNGSKVDGWKFKKTEYRVTEPVQTFSYDKKDYLIFSDSLKIYIVNRKGEERITVKNYLPKAPGSVFVFDSQNKYFLIHYLSLKGNIISIYPDGHCDNFSDIEKPVSRFQIINNDNNQKHYCIISNNEVAILDNEKKEIETIKSNEPILKIRPNNTGIMAYSYNAIKSTLNTITLTGYQIKDYPLHSKSEPNILSLNKNIYYLIDFSTNSNKIICYQLP